VDKIAVRLGVVTVTYNSAVVLPEFLECIALQTLRDFTLIVIDNASTDGSVALIAEKADSRIELIRNLQNLGVAEGNNQGIRRAIERGCSHVLFLNNDTAFDSKMFEQMMSAGMSHRVVVPKIYLHDSPKTLWFAGGKFNRFLGYSTNHFGENEDDVGQFNTSGPTEYAPTCCMLVRVDVFASVGMMDACFFVYYDDTDFCLRLSRGRIDIWYQPTISMSHKVGSLTGGIQSAFSARMNVRNKVYFCRKNLSAVSATYFLVLYGVYLLLRFIARKDSWQRFRLKISAFIEGRNVGNRPPLRL
jgi:GT2 family glycosyltransferase